MNNTIQNCVKSISYLEFINNLDSAFYDLLYSSKNGYINLHSKNAVNDFCSYIEKFDAEISKISQNIDCAQLGAIIDNKKQEFVEELNKHYLEEVKVWAQDVFEDLIQNVLFYAGLNKDNSKNLDAAYNRALSSIGWFCGISGLDNKDKNLLVENFNKDFKDALNSSFSDFIPKNRTNKTNPSMFLKLFNMYRKNYDNFMSIDFQTTLDGISTEDLTYFNSLKIKSSSSEKNIKDDEIDLINCAISLLNLKTDNNKYEFIKLLLRDFDNFFKSNKKITEDDKILLVKRRMELYKDNSDKKQDYKYYRKKLTSLSE